MVEMNDIEDRGGRRRADRRKAQLPFDGPERRKAARRRKTDRRAKPRIAAE
ncbi:MAG: hypothetical protein WBA68_10985 [Alteraurantiacibacter sp.]